MISLGDDGTMETVSKICTPNRHMYHESFALVRILGSEVSMEYTIF